MADLFRLLDTAPLRVSAILFATPARCGWVLMMCAVIGAVIETPN